jgi:hypothetical protein
MKSWQFAVVGLALLATAGCRSDPAIGLLERELRHKEDEIYRLRASLEDMQDCGQSCQQRSAPAEPDEAPPPRRRRGSSAAPNGVASPKVEMPSQPTSEVPDTLKSPAGAMPLGVPEVPENLQGPSKPLNPRDGGPSRPNRDHTRSPGPAELDGPALESGPGGVTARPGRFTLAGQSASAVPVTPTGDSRHVSRIVLNRTLTGGVNAGNGAGDQGLLVVVEPLDRAGRIVDAPAEMSVVVRDQALTGEAARVARWDFTAAETAAMFRRTGAGAAIHLTAAWPGDPPAHHKLHLYVRYMTADRRELRAETPIEVSLPGDKTARWTPSDRPAEPPAISEQEPLTARVPGPTPYMAGRTEAKSRRPVWSPDRQ